MNNIPTFRYNSKQLIDFKNQHMIDEPVRFKYFERHWYNSTQITVTSSRKVWAKSGIKYIVDHGGFKTLETSVAQQQNTTSGVL